MRIFDIIEVLGALRSDALLRAQADGKQETLEMWKRTADAITGAMAILHEFWCTANCYTPDEAIGIIKNGQTLGGPQGRIWSERIMVKDADTRKVLLRAFDADKHYAVKDLGIVSIHSEIETYKTLGQANCSSSRIVATVSGQLFKEMKAAAEAKKPKRKGAI